MVSSAGPVNPTHGRLMRVGNTRVARGKVQSHSPWLLLYDAQEICGINAARRVFMGRLPMRLSLSIED